MSDYANRPRVPKTMLVSPTLTDPSMRSEKNDAVLSSAQILKEMGEDYDDIHGTVFNPGYKKTKEELTVSKDDTGSTSTLLIIVFALIVIALVALVVWMVMKQNENADDNNELKARLHPHSRNHMPPLGHKGVPYNRSQNLQPSSQQPVCPQSMRNQVSGTQPVTALQQPLETPPVRTLQQPLETPPVTTLQQPLETPPVTTLQQPLETPPVTTLQRNYVSSNQPPTQEFWQIQPHPQLLKMPPTSDIQQASHHPASNQIELDEIFNKTNEMLKDSGELTVTDRNMLNSFAHESYVNGDDDGEET
jgi:hypothetical protein